MDKTPLLEYYTELANNFGVDVSTLLNSPGSVSKVFDRLYFRERGTHRYPGFLEYMRVQEMELFRE